MNCYLKILSLTLLVLLIITLVPTAGKLFTSLLIQEPASCRLSSALLFPALESPSLTYLVVIIQQAALVNVYLFIVFLKTTNQVFSSSYLQMCLHSSACRYNFTCKHV